MSHTSNTANPGVKHMPFDSVSPSAVRSIKQQDFVKVWYRIFERTGQLPTLAAFQPSRLEDEKPELMYYDVVRAGDDIRYPATYAGTRLVEAYGFSAVGRDIQDILSPVIWKHVEPLYDKCVNDRVPVYSIFTVTDLKGDTVNFERLLLPFGEGDQVQQMIASIKSISIEGRFVNTDLMRSRDHAPIYHLRAVVSRASSAPTLSCADDLIEI
jgi:hypothetical protein